MTQTFNPPNANASLESLTHAELLAKRAELVTRANGSPSSLSEADLTDLVNIISLLRRRSSGPPKEKKTTAAKTLVDLDNL